MITLSAGAAGEPVGVLLSGKAGAAHEALQDPAVAGLAQFGYPVSACMEALQRLKGDPDAAHQDLFGRLTGGLLTNLLNLSVPAVRSSAARGVQQQELGCLCSCNATNQI